MKTSTMKKSRKFFMCVSRISMLIGVLIPIIWVAKFGLQESHDSDIFLKALIATMIFVITSSVAQMIADSIKERIASRYRRKHIEQQRVQLQIEDIRRKTTLY